MTATYAYPETAQVTWAELRCKFRRALGRDAAQEWMDATEPLRLLNGEHSMFTVIPEYFQAVTRRSTFHICTVVDFAFLQSWADAGISAHVVRSGMESVLERIHNPLYINSVRYFERSVFRCAELLKEARVGTRRENSLPGPEPWTLLLALPRSGRVIYKAKMDLSRVLELNGKTLSPNLRVALTVQPDDYQREQVGDFLEDNA